jgi:ATP-dependent DNA helicase Rep
MVTLTTLHASKGLEWPHVVLAGVNEGILPFKSDTDEMTAERLEEERRLMYVGITRAQRTLVVSTLRRRKKGLPPHCPTRSMLNRRLVRYAYRADNCR